MKKVCIAIVILLANAAFISCTDLDENLEKEPTKSEILATEGEEGQDPDDGDDDEKGNGNGG